MVTIILVCLYHSTTHFTYNIIIRNQSEHKAIGGYLLTPSCEITVMISHGAYYIFLSQSLQNTAVIVGKLKSHVRGFPLVKTYKL